VAFYGACLWSVSKLDGLVLLREFDLPWHVHHLFSFDLLLIRHIGVVAAPQRIRKAKAISYTTYRLSFTYPVPLVSYEARTLVVDWLQRTVILGADIIEVLWTGRCFATGSYVAVFFAGIGFGWGLEILFLGLFHD
jgi:hypothetical protein